MDFQTYYKRTGQSNAVLLKINYNISKTEVKDLKSILYVKVQYKIDGENKEGFLSLEQVKHLIRSKSQDMEITIDGEKRYISSTLLDIYLLENEGLIYINGL